MLAFDILDWAQHGPSRHPDQPIVVVPPAIPENGHLRSGKMSGK